MKMEHVLNQEPPVCDSQEQDQPPPAPVMFGTLLDVPLPSPAMPLAPLMGSTSTPIVLPPLNAITVKREEETPQNELESDWDALLHTQYELPEYVSPDVDLCLIQQLEESSLDEDELDLEARGFFGSPGFFAQLISANLDIHQDDLTVLNAQQQQQQQQQIDNIAILNDSSEGNTTCEEFGSFTCSPFHTPVKPSRQNTTKPLASNTKKTARKSMTFADFTTSTTSSSSATTTMTSSSSTSNANSSSTSTNARRLRCRPAVAYCDDKENHDEPNRQRSPNALEVTSKSTRLQTIPPTQQALENRRLAGRKSKDCCVPGCTKGARSKGLCKRHGGGKRCTFQDCSRSDQGGGFCIAHGGGKRCSTAGCKNSAQSRGLCKSHGGGKRCSVQGCTKSSQEAGLCRSHGGGRYCKAVDCNEPRTFSGYCHMHAKAII